MATINATITNGVDDGYHNSLSLLGTATTVKFGRDESKGSPIYTSAWLRFDVTGIAGGEINSATLTLVQDGLTSGTNTVIVAAEAVAAAAVPTSVANYNAKSLTTAQVTQSSWGASQAIDVTTIVQELADLGATVAQFMLRQDANIGLWSVAAFEHESADPATLVIDYTAAPEPEPEPAGHGRTIRKAKRIIFSQEAAKELGLL